MLENQEKEIRPEETHKRKIEIIENQKNIENAEESKEIENNDNINEKDEDLSGDHERLIYTGKRIYIPTIEQYDISLETETQIFKKFNEKNNKLCDLESDAFYHNVQCVDTPSITQLSNDKFLDRNLKCIAMRKFSDYILKEVKERNFMLNKIIGINYHKKNKKFKLLAKDYVTRNVQIVKSLIKLRERIVSIYRDSEKTYNYFYVAKQTSKVVKTLK
ncbi:hypothetical protein SLOPH_984 [Spraguea lophii 42_110]|uniref:Uncharacterized protein n=1 Tax=Spraguea lophii (strain 42_110) TaxID=1358809 RepID=S7W7N3_SPRLO|nr:hypothetical protein SLOPH_984 [Spraguea lophii 42_110]